MYALEQVKQVSILDIAEHLGFNPVKSSSNTYKAKHNMLRDEKSSSLFFYVDTNRYHDYGSGDNGSVIDLVMNAKGYSLSEAREWLGNYYGINKPLTLPLVSTNESKKPNLNLIAKLQREELKKLFTCREMGTVYSLEIRNLVQELVSPNMYLGTKKPLSSLGYSSRDKSLTVILEDKAGDVKAIRTRHFTDVNGSRQKWKCLGEIKFIPCKLTGEEIVFCAFGTAEMLLFECLNVNYFVLQSDSVAKSLADNPYFTIIKEKLTGKMIVVLLDNDESCHGAFKQMKQTFGELYFIGIDFESIKDRRLPKGYDFRDFANEIANKASSPDMAREEILLVLLNEIEKIMKGENL